MTSPTRVLSKELIFGPPKSRDIAKQAQVSFFLVINDLKGKRKVSYEEDKAYADQIGTGLIETSAKDCVNVEEAFLVVVSEIKTRAQLNENYHAYIRDQMKEGDWDQKFAEMLASKEKRSKDKNAPKEAEAEKDKEKEVKVRVSQ